MRACVRVDAWEGAFACSFFIVMNVTYDNPDDASLPMQAYHCFYSNRFLLFRLFENALLVTLFVLVPPEHEVGGSDWVLRCHAGGCSFFFSGLRQPNDGLKLGAPRAALLGQKLHPLVLPLEFQVTGAWAGRV